MIGTTLVTSANFLKTVISIYVTNMFQHISIASPVKQVDRWSNSQASKNAQ